MSLRTVRKVVVGTKAKDGAGVHLTRVLGHETVQDFDPFLMLDAFDSKNPQEYVMGFPKHPHRGMETVTYLISGEIEHQDSLGHKGVIKDGSAQWMTAGSGIVHQEMPHPSEHLLGVQLWINLPRKVKMTKPAYRDLQAENMPKVEDKDSSVIVISGEYKGVKSSFQGDFIQTQFWDVSLKPGAFWEVTTDKEATVFAYLVDGRAAFDEEGKDFMENKRAVLFSYDDKLKAKAGDEGCRFLLFAARPVKEPVAWGGPVVMNSREELAEAYDELDRGSFVKHS